MDSGFPPESTRLGRYHIVKRLGGGETSEVLLAVLRGPHGFERIVVLKRLLPKYEWDESMARMLATEAVAYARLTHPAIVRLYDFFDFEGRAVLVLEHVDGFSLAELQGMLRTRGESLTDPAALYIASRVFAALAAAHAARDPRSGEFAPVVHRDVSPSSVLLPWDGFAKLGDFGFAKVKGLTGETSDTRRGLLKGTLGYMAPEQVLGERVTPRTDVYAGCLLLRELLVARPAFDPEMQELELMRAMAETHLAPIETLRGGISPSLTDAMFRGLARDPEARTLTAAEMGRVLRQETDLALAQMSLIDTLSRVAFQPRASTPATGTRASPGSSPSGTMRFERMHLPPEAMPSDSALGNAIDSDSHPTLKFETPHAVMMVGQSAPPLASTVRPPATRRGAPLLLATGLLGLAACVALGVALRASAPRPDAARRARPPVVALTVPPVASSPPPSPPAAIATTPEAPSPPSPAPASTLGDVLTPEHAHSHRVFVDGRYAAPRSGATLTLRCGKHLVRIGSRGRDQPVEVPCGGTVTVDVP